jgi:hypothetical protein
MNKKIIDIWDELDDEMRCRWLIKMKDRVNVPKYELHIKNGSVYLLFIDEKNVTLHFDNSGHDLLLHIFNAIGLKNIIKDCK